MPTKKSTKTEDELKKTVIVTLYLDNPHEPMIRVAMPLKQAKEMRATLMSGIPYLFNNPVYASVSHDIASEQPTHLLKDERKGLSIIINPRNWTHIYIDQYRER
ncbi:MAG: hypothetical protein KGZ81_07280 [Flavobacteriales bacterium]|nr:hypothetical protein [Flavobacteriales bacterium]